MQESYSLFEAAHNIVIDFPIAEYELDYFKKVVTWKVNEQNMRQWGALDCKFLPSLRTRLDLP